MQSNLITHTYHMDHHLKLIATNRKVYTDALQHNG